jgi:polysaccharide export outer membrane protein
MVTFDQTTRGFLVTLAWVFIWPDENRSSRTTEVEMREKTAWKTAASLAILLLTSAALVMAADDAKRLASTSGEAEYRIGAEDVIEVFVWKEPDLSTTVVVRPDGRISLPLASELEASGKTAVELQAEITARLSKYAIQPVVNVMVKQVNSLKISVLGEVRRPDVYKIKNRVTVLDALAMAGGFTDLARPNKVIVLRSTPGGPQRIKVNIKQLVDDDTGAPFYLQTLDTVYVE